MKTIYLAGGCFWGAQAFFDQFDGVLATRVGFANGNTADPAYAEVRRGDTGHAETVEIRYDESRISLRQLLDFFFLAIDPLSVNRQGEDVGTQYRTGIYYTDDGDLPQIREVYARQEEAAGAPLAVELEPLRCFYPAEEYHQDYLKKNPGGYCHIPSRLLHMREG